MSKAALKLKSSFKLCKLLVFIRCFMLLRLLSIQQVCFQVLAVFLSFKYNQQEICKCLMTMLLDSLSIKLYFFSILVQHYHDFTIFGGIIKYIFGIVTSSRYTTNILNSGSAVTTLKCRFIENIFLKNVLSKLQGKQVLFITRQN